MIINIDLDHHRGNMSLSSYKAPNGKVGTQITWRVLESSLLTTNELQMIADACKAIVATE